MPVRMDWTINIGTVLQILSMCGCVVVVVVSVSNRLKAFETTLKQHGDALQKHDTTLSVYETRILDIVSNLQRLIGRMEGSHEGNSRVGANARRVP